MTKAGLWSCFSKDLPCFSVTNASETVHNSLTPPPPLPLRTLRIEQDTDADFPPPPDFEDTLMQRSSLGSKILVDPNAKHNAASMMTNSYHSGMSGKHYLH